jgi:raffinose/stachyose/melibiose transport system substrate-binding protein
VSGSLRIGYITEVQQVLEPIVADFKKKYPNVDLKVEYTPVSQYIQSYITQARAGNAPDVMWSGAGSATPVAPGTLGNTGGLVDLSALPAAKALPQAIRADVVNNKDQVMALPPSISIDGLIYNEDMLKQAGVEPPKTFADLLSACKALSAKGKTPVAMSSEPILMSAVVNQLGAAFVTSKVPDWATQRATGKTTFASSPEWRRAMQAFVQMKEGGCFSKGAQGTTSTQTLNQMATEQAAMIVNGSSWIAGVLAANPATGAKLRIEPFPNDAGDGLVTPVPASGIGINPKAKNLEGAKAFMDFAMSPAVSAQAAKAGGGVTLEQMKSGDVPPSMSALKTDLQNGKYRQVSVVGWPATAQPAMATQMGGLLTGQTDAAKVLKAADKAWDSAGS